MNTKKYNINYHMCDQIYNNYFIVKVPTADDITTTPIDFPSNTLDVIERGMLEAKMNLNTLRKYDRYWV